MCECKDCVWAVKLDDGWIYCSWNGIWVGDSDSCSRCWPRKDWLRLVRCHGKGSGVFRKDGNRESWGQ